MKVVVNENSPIERTVEVCVESTQVDRSFDRHISELMRTVHIPGFRKGKAPRKIAERYVNQDALRRTVFEEVAGPAYEEALEQQNLSPVGQPNVELVQLAPGQDLIFKATFEIRPEVELPRDGYEGLEVEVDKIEVTDEDVQTVLEDIQKKHVRTVAVEEERPLQVGDVAVVDFTSRVGEEPVPNGDSENYQMDINDSSFLPGFANNLVGMTVDERKTFDVEFPESYPNKNLAGHNVTFDFHLKSIKRRELPELDDDLAKEAGRFSTLDELRSSIRTRLAGGIQNEIGNRAMEKLVETSAIPIPKAYLHQMINFMITGQAQQLAQVGVRLEDFLQARNMTLDALVHDLHPQAEKMARAELLSDAVIRAESLEISDEELESEIQNMADHTGQEAEAVRRALTERKELDNFRRDALRRKVMRLLAERAKPVLKSAGAEGAGGEAVAVEDAGQGAEAEAAQDGAEEAASEAKPEKPSSPNERSEPAEDDVAQEEPAARKSRARKASRTEAGPTEVGETAATS